MQQRNPQEFDNTLKALFGNEAKEILPHLIPEAELIDDKNVEIDRTLLKADLVYNILYRGEPHILDMELQTAADARIDTRVLQYHVGLHAKHKKPVITVIMYPFETTIPEPPYLEMSGNEVLLALYYRVLALWKLEAQKFVQERAICMYTLLPAMRGVNAAMLIQALHEMKEHYTRQQFGHHLIRFKRIAERSKTLLERDKQRVEEEIRMYMAYDWFIDENPDVQERVAKKEIEVLQQMALDAVDSRFSSLTALARQRIPLIQKPDILRQLVKQLFTAPDEAEVQHLLNTVEVQ
jgi:hypothetical protein